MSEQDGRQASTLQRPITNDPEAWKAYWQEQGQLWRTEPEIDEERQEYFTERRSIAPDIEKGIYPFKGIKLSRADVEWLLATHEHGRGPIDWNDEKQRKRKGLDLRGTDLSKEDLSGLPLARLNSGLKVPERFVTDEQTKMAAVRMEEANLKGAQLQNAYLREARLQQANLFDTQLVGAYLYRAQLQNADLSWALLQQTNLREAQLQGANFFETQLQKTYLKGAQLQAAQLSRAKLEDAVLDGAILSDEKYGPALLADVDWGEVNLAVVDWSAVKRIGDEQRAQQTKVIDDYRAAVRANRQLSVVLRDQGLNEEADRFAYRAQVCSQPILFLQLLQNIVKQEKLRRLMHTPQKPSDYLNLLASATMMLVCTFGMWLVLTMLPRLASTFGGHSVQVVSGVVWLVLVVLYLSILLIYQPLVRLLLVFLLLLTLDLILLYLVLLLLVSTLLSSVWQVNLLFLFLTILMIATILWNVHTKPEERIHGLEALLNGITMILWEQVIKNYGRYIYLWLLPFAQLQVDGGRYIFSLFLNALAGYGYRPGRSLFWYLVIIFGFAIGYHSIGNIPILPNAFVLSLTSFHGRGFFPGFESKTALDNPLVILAAVEAVVGLFIEISFIATFTQRFFGK